MVLKSWGRKHRNFFNMRETLNASYWFYTMKIWFNKLCVWVFVKKRVTTLGGRNKLTRKAVLNLDNLGEMKLGIIKWTRIFNVIWFKVLKAFRKPIDMRAYFTISFWTGLYFFDELMKNMFWCLANVTQSDNKTKRMLLNDFHCYNFELLRTLA